MFFFFLRRASGVTGPLFFMGWLRLGVSISMERAGVWVPFVVLNPLLLGLQLSAWFGAWFGWFGLIERNGTTA